MLFDDGARIAKQVTAQVSPSEGLFLQMVARWGRMTRHPATGNGFLSREKEFEAGSLMSIYQYSFTERQK